MAGKPGRSGRRQKTGAGRYVRLQDEHWEDLCSLALLRHRTTCDLIRFAVQEYLARRKANPGLPEIPVYAELVES